MINGETTIQVVCTDGFRELAELRDYQIDLKKTWHVKLFEAPPGSGGSASFKPLATVPVSTTLN